RNRRCTDRWDAAGGSGSHRAGACAGSARGGVRSRSWLRAIRGRDRVSGLGASLRPRPACLISFEAGKPVWNQATGGAAVGKFLAAACPHPSPPPQAGEGAKGSSLASCFPPPASHLLLPTSFFPPPAPLLLLPASCSPSRPPHPPPPSSVSRS